MRHTPDIPILGLVSARHRRRLVSALPTIALLESWADVTVSLRRHSSVLVVVDTSFAPEIAREIRAVKRLHPEVEFLLLSTLEPDGMRQCVEAAQAGAGHVAFAGYDDSPERLTGIVEEIVIKSGISSIAEPIKVLLRQLPPALQDAATRLFESPSEFHITQDFARAAGMSTRSMFRHLRSGGIPSCRRLIAAAHVMAAFRLLNRSSVPAQKVAERLSYSSVDQLSAHLAELAHCTCRDLQRGVPESAFTGAVISSLRSTRKRAAQTVDMA